VLALPAGEHDYFERKAGQLLASPERFRGALAKATSALANSGGGSLLLGVEDTGAIDGMPPRHGNTGTREWIEQLLPNLVAHPLTEFRVHEVEVAKSGSAIPLGTVVIVADVGDSPAAPHQCNYGGGDAQKYVYYMRQGGHSVPAPHHYVELVRQRLTAPLLRAEFVGLRLRQVGEVDGAVFAHSELVVHVKNEGRIAAYKWQVQPTTLSGFAPGRPDDYQWNTLEFPVRDNESGIRIDDTILPGGFLEHTIPLGLWLRPDTLTLRPLATEIRALLGSASLNHRIATEVGLSDEAALAIGSNIDAMQLARDIKAALSPGT